jgi:Fe-S-cluster containining protein
VSLDCKASKIKRVIDGVELQQAIALARGRADARAAIEALYAHIQDVIDLRRPICNTSGRCCRFEEFGHRLFVTTIELAVFADEVGARGEDRGASVAGCQYQIDGLCSVHAIRPFGCRIFFCDATAAVWQAEQYERFHARIRKLHDDLNIPYFYVEWREGLRAAGLKANPVVSGTSALTGKADR